MTNLKSDRTTFLNHPGAEAAQHLAQQVGFPSCPSCTLVSPNDPQAGFDSLYIVERLWKPGRQEALALKFSCARGPASVVGDIEHDAFHERGELRRVGSLDEEAIVSAFRNRRRGVVVSLDRDGRTRGVRAHSTIPLSFVHYCNDPSDTNRRIADRVVLHGQELDIRYSEQRESFMVRSITNLGKFAPLENICPNLDERTKQELQELFLHPPSIQVLNVKNRQAVERTQRFLDTGMMSALTPDIASTIDISVQPAQSRVILPGDRGRLVAHGTGRQGRSASDTLF